MIEEIVSDRLHLLAEIAPGNLDVSIVGELPPSQPSLGNHLEPRALEVERLKAAWGWA
jgi:hypothetical protein